jgi:hypothetical protein
MLSSQKDTCRGPHGLRSWPEGAASPDVAARTPCDIAVLRIVNPCHALAALSEEASMIAIANNTNAT